MRNVEAPDSIIARIIVNARHAYYTNTPIYKFIIEIDNKVNIITQAWIKHLNV